MKITESLKATGALTIVRSDQNGKVLEKRHVPNLVVTVGKEFIASRMVGTTSTVMTHMSLGTSDTSPVSGNTTLGSEVGRAALQSAAASGTSVTYGATFNAGVGTGAIKEAGIFNSGTSNAGTMLCRTVFPVVNKGASDIVAITWVVTIS